MKIAILSSQYYPEVCGGLLEGAKVFLAEKGLPLEEKNCFFAPGAFEIPLLAQALAKTKKYDGIVCLGCVVKGETAHFEYINLGVSVGITQAALQTGVPITFGILTTYTKDEALARSRRDENNKGREAMAACWEAIATLKKITADDR